jgi:uncharacterized protein YdeI (YjbR/CyaY-like superfamily)
MNPNVDFFFTKAKKWKGEYARLRELVLDYGLTEELKWGVPCYTIAKKNVVLIHGFKDYCAVLFMKGSLMKNPKKILIQQTPNVQAARQLRFTNEAEIIKLAPTIKAYVKEAIALEKAGVKVPFKKTAEYDLPAEFRSVLNKMPALQKAFESLTPGRQRAYLFYFAQAKLTKTRESRIEKAIPNILDGKGIDD